MDYLKSGAFLLLIFTFVICLFVPGTSLYLTDYNQKIKAYYQDVPDWFVKINPALYPVNLNKSKLPEFSAEGIVVVDVNSAVTVYQKNETKSFYPASTTKLMTGLVTVENYGLKEILKVPDMHFSGSNMGLKPKEKVDVNNLLHGLLINSGNDAAEVLAKDYPVGREKFIERMNSYAKEIGTRNTHFNNPSGLFESNHYTTAWDLGQIAVKAWRNPILRQIMQTKKYTAYGLNGEKHELESTNKLLGEVNGVDGMKTGYTEEAGEVLVTTVERDGHRIIIVMLKSNDRFGETAKLIEWVYQNVEWKKV